MDSNSTFPSENRSATGSNNILTSISNKLPENRSTELVINDDDDFMDISLGSESSTTQLKLGSPTDCQPNKILTTHNERTIRCPLSDRANTSTPRLFRPPALHVSQNDYSSTGDDTAHRKLSQSMCLADISSSSCRSQNTGAIPGKECLNVFGGSFPSGDFAKMKQLPSQNFYRRPALKRSSRLKYTKLHSDGTAKLWDVLPTVRRSRTVSESSIIEKCRGDDEDENLENEFSFRSHLQGTVGNRMISTDLPSTSTPTRLESRVTKRRTVEEMEGIEEAKKMKEDQPMEEGARASSSPSSAGQEMDVEMAEEQQSDEGEDNRPSSELSCKENASSGRTSRASALASASTSVQRSFSTSVFETAEAKEKSPPGILEVKYSLQIIKKPDVPSTAFGSITAQTLFDTIKSMTEEQFMDSFLLIDCRYPFEYNGGHIRGSHNVFDPIDVEKFFYPRNLKLRKKRMAMKPIFFCEFSQMRGPQMANELRAYDRKLNVIKYPYVDYPEMYLLQYGYRNFFMQFSSNNPELFEPVGYVTMDDKRHQQELASYKFHRTRTTTAVYHSLARDRCSRQHAKAQREAQSSRMDVDEDMRTPSPDPHRLPRRLVFSPESPSQFPETSSQSPKTPTGRPRRERDKRSSKVCRSLFPEGDGEEED